MRANSLLVGLLFSATMLSCSDDKSKDDSTDLIEDDDVERLARINEFSAKSLSDATVPNSDLDWLEIKNISDESLVLTGYYLTDDPTQLTKWNCS